MARRHSNNFVSQTNRMVNAMIERISNEIERKERGRRPSRRSRAIQVIPVDAGYNVYGVHGRHLAGTLTS